MSFTGDLEQLPIVDVVQLMNSTRKSGILSVEGRKGESQLVFKDRITSYNVCYTKLLRALIAQLSEDLSSLLGLKFNSSNYEISNKR